MSEVSDGPRTMYDRSRERKAGRKESRENEGVYQVTRRVVFTRWNDTR
jgi:hypothetical protein